eukprot:2097366-Pleurochrysis_carterae.AAC.1
MERSERWARQRDAFWVHEDQPSSECHEHRLAAEKRDVRFLYDGSETHRIDRSISIVREPGRIARVVRLGVDHPEHEWA